METLTHIINNARFLGGRVIMLLDFENAFGIVNYNLLIESTKLHRVQDDVIILTSSLFSDYNIPILTDSFMTSPIRVQKDILQVKFIA